MASSPTPSSPTVPTNKKLTPDDFEFKELLGQGSYAKVLLSILKSTGVKYATKIVDKKFILRHNKQKYVMNEKTCLTLLNHPNIIKLYYTFHDDDHLYFVLELATGGELYELVRLLGRFNIELTVFFAAELLNAMKSVHLNSMCHRDLKPENILLTDKYHIKLTDFGTAKQLNLLTEPIENDSSKSEDQNHRGSSTTQRNSFVGTAEYVAPEILKGEPAGYSADFWSYGCIIYQMLCGRPPFRGASEYLTFQQILTHALVFPSYVTEEARDLISSLLTLHPSERLGCKESSSPKGWDAVRSHPFFNGIDFENLINLPCPHFEIPGTPLLSFPVVNPVVDDEIETDIDSATDVVDKSTMSFSLSKPLSSNSQESTSIAWYCRFLLPGECVIYTELVVKTRIFSKKTRQLILTNRPRFIYIDIENMEQKGEIEWSFKLWAESKSPNNFIVHTPNRDWYFETSSETGVVNWVEVINNLRREHSMKLQTPTSS